MTAPYLGYSNYVGNVNLDAILGRVFNVEDYGAVGDGTTNDSQAFWDAETARLAHVTGGGYGVLIGAAGKTYALGAINGYYKPGGAGARGPLFAIRAAGLVDFSRCTLKYTGTTNLGQGSDGYFVGVVNVVVSGATFLGTIECQGGGLLGTAELGLCFANSVIGFGFNATIRNPREPGIWSGMAYSMSQDVSNAAFTSARAQMIDGRLVRPDCPAIDDGGNITDHGNVTAYVYGGEVIQADSTGFALVGSACSSGEPFNTYHLLMAGAGVPLYPKTEDNARLCDFITHDLGVNAIEIRGHPNTSGTDYGSGTVPGVALAGGGYRPNAYLGKRGTPIYLYNTGYDPVDGSTQPPNVWLHAGDAAGQGAMGGSVGLYRNARTIAASTTGTYYDSLVLVNAVGGPVTYTLPNVLAAKYQLLTIKKIDASGNAVTLGGTIDGAVNPTLAAQWKTMTIQSDGSAWYTVSAL